MTLLAGARLGPYEVIAPLGAGGMGEVYRARDPRLGREVALKVLPTELSSDASRLKRFEKEARSASGLNHPNIVTIYEIGSADSVSYIAMELVEGKTLRELLASGPLPVKRVLQLSAQIADGLARAHEVGIVHRDLKPENLMVTKNGLVKILDFGLAKLTGPVSGSDEGSHLPTETGTSPGLIMGTVGYMSPEQAIGQPLDFRSDQFSFGTILYEMCSGSRAFQKKNAIETLSAILKEEPPPLASVAPEVPSALSWVTERCLAKDPTDRYASSRDLARDLIDLRDRPERQGAGTAVAPALRRRPRLGAFAVALALLGSIIFAVFLLGKRFGESPPPVFRRMTFRRGAVSRAFFAPDGHTIVYSASFDRDAERVFSARTESPEASLLPLPSAQLCSVSSSGELAISIDGTLARVALAGGGAREILDWVSDADWSPDGSSLAVARNAPDKRWLEYPIGKVVYETNGWIRIPRVSPDGDLVAFLDHPVLGSERGTIAVVDRSGKVRRLTREFAGVQALAWSAGGNEIWYTGGDAAISAVSLEGRQRVVLGAAGDIGIEDVGADGRALVTLNTPRAGILASLPGQPGERDFSWFDFSFARDLSADGRLVLFHEAGAGASSTFHDTYTRKSDGSAAVRLGEGESWSLSPDGRWALCVVHASSPRLELLPTGTGTKRTLERGSLARYGTAGWLPNGRSVFFTGEEAKGKPRVYIQDVARGAPRAIAPEGFRATPAVTPDGRLILVRAPDRKLVLLPADGGPVVSMTGVEPDDIPIRFDARGDLLVERRELDLTRLVRLAANTGRREVLREVKPPDLAGLEELGGFRVTPDGRFYVYNYVRNLADLYLVEGLK